MINILIQLACFLLLVQAVVWCMPTSWQRAAHANCIRPDGTRSPNRSRLEQHAFNRLRLEMLAPLTIIFLTGNAIYQTIDRSIAPVETLFARSSDSVNNTAQGIVTPESAKPIPSGAWLKIAAMSFLWLFSSVAILGWSLASSYRSFVRGVRERSREYYQFDVTRSTPEATPKSVPKGVDVA